MGYILHLIDAPGVASATEGGAFISGERGKPPAANHKFKLFVQEITKAYPDLSEDDLDGDDDGNLWEEGLSEEADYGRVKELVVKVDLTDETVVNELARVAALCGLKLYDEEGMVLYGA